MRLARTASPLPRRSGRQESNLRSPAPEAGGVANSPTARRSAPGGTRTRSFRVEGPASSPVRPRGRSSGGRDRTCASRVTVARLAARPHRNEAEGDPGRIRTCTSPIKSRQLCQLSYGAEVWSAGVEPARPAFQAGALPFELRPQRWATLSKLRDKGSNLDLHVQSVASFRLRRSRIGGRPAGAGEHPPPVSHPAPPSTSPRGSSTQQRDRTVCGLLSPLSRPVQYRTMFSKPLAYPSTLDHRPVRARARRSPSYVEGFWSPFLARCRINGQAKAHAALPRSFPAHSRESFSLRRGLDFDLTLVQAEHHLWFGSE
jgi:hypothetical protein